MKRLWTHVAVRPRMSLAAAVGLVAGLLAPADTAVGRALVGWNIGVWTYLALMSWVMARADHGHLRRSALAQTPGAAVVLGLVVGASVASIVAIVAELAWVRHVQAAPLALAHVLLALGTVVGGWLLLPLVFTLNYASHYYRHTPPAGLKFPDVDPSFHPNYVDFLYFSFTIAVAAQTADVAITSRPMRRLVLLQALLSFAFNTAILAMAVNIAAGLLPAPR
ncbi:DUF1345 domain-containing protein [Ideonella sp.]|uniref:DUF1345 domain-containing protein n=1 Tax=Ideonella sp. TaxID=1929293 RepID=UPI002B45B08D|nr:DUF1345 domain-containing protein [Ideonella sp.]HJV71163.1 DUF1345 domain-containing protein [Ideonella sp.]